ncbi:hypothetical protein GCM10007382_20080 [Salinibacterium xinjiangense]|nr:DUF817 family protein [Salinibacterium xinjiangense]GGL00121.1 hypothetical protein GCM10007382_20080 [Salinibacterium xinjiangense]
MARAAIEVAMVATRLEGWREIRVIILFHIEGTGMERFKTGIGSWLRVGDGVLHIGGVPFCGGSIYTAIDLWMVRV